MHLLVLSRYYQRYCVLGLHFNASLSAAIHMHYATTPLYFRRFWVCAGLTFQCWRGPIHSMLLCTQSARSYCQKYFQKLLPKLLPKYYQRYWVWARFTFQLLHWMVAYAHKQLVQDHTAKILPSYDQSYFQNVEPGSHFNGSTQWFNGGLCTQRGFLLLLFRGCKVDIGKWRGNWGIEEELSPYYHTATPSPFTRDSWNISQDIARDIAPCGPIWLLCHNSGSAKTTPQRVCATIITPAQY